VKKIFIGLLALSSVSAFAEKTCTETVQNLKNLGVICSLESAATMFAKDLMNKAPASVKETYKQKYQDAFKAYANCLAVSASVCDE
jgi:hypothetical protein